MQRHGDPFDFAQGRRRAVATTELDTAIFTCEEFSMGREIDLDGGELTIIKALGVSGAGVLGKTLLQHIGEMGDAEFLDTLDGLMTRGLVLSTKSNVTTTEEVQRSFFRVNPSYSRDLRDAMRHDWQRDKEKSRRRRG